MKKKKIFKSVIAGAAMLALSGLANATQYEINIYGASAQHKFWNAAAPGFLTNQLGCTATAQSSNSKKHGITRGTNCTADGMGTNDDTVYIRYSSKASYDGIQAVNGVDPDAQCPTEGGEYREMVDETTCSWTGSGDNSCSLKCVDVTLGASDVQGSSIEQSSAGFEKGHLGGAWISPFYSGIPTDGLDYANPVVVPFGFYANNNVTVTRCTAPGADVPDGASKSYPHLGWKCLPDANGHSGDCIGYYKCVDNLCSGGVNQGQACTIAEQCPDVALEDTTCMEMPIVNMSRLMGILLFKDNMITNWNQFGPWYPDLQIVKCMRHAGSGTHATLDLAVMRRDANPIQGSLPPTVYHYRSSSDLMKCVDAFDGAVGYADADKLLGSKGINNVHALTYQGVEPTRKNIENCTYNFWAAQWVYWDGSDTTEISTEKAAIIDSLMAYACDSANLNYANIGYRADFWAAQSDMSCKKDNDRAYPRWNP